jgi:hypothetical protein
MRRTLTACRTGIAVAAAVVLLAACGSDDDGSSSQASGTPTETTESGAPEEDSEFCRDASTIQQRVDATLTDQSDPTALPQTLQAAAEEIRSIEPPDEIAAEWEALAGGVEQIAAALSTVDFDDPDALATFQEQIGRIQADLGTASTDVQRYLTEQCGIEIEMEPSESASPSS